MPRNSTIDVVRGIGILLVVLGHTANIPQWLHKGIYAFHMPMFFILSGYLFNADKAAPTAVAWRLLWRLIVPYFFIGLTCAIPSIATGHTASVSDFFWKLGGTLYSVPRPSNTFFCTPIWFLTCLFCVEVTYACIWTRMRQATGIIVGAVVLAGLVLLQYLNFFYPWNVQIAMVVLGFYHFGTMLRRIGILERGRAPAWTIPILAAVLFAAVYGAPVEVNLTNNQLAGDLLLFAVGAVTGSLAIFDLATWIPAVPAHTFLGTNTIFILGYNYWVMKISGAMVGTYVGWQADFVAQALVLGMCAALAQRSGILRAVFSGKGWPETARTTQQSQG